MLEEKTAPVRRRDKVDAIASLQTLVELEQEVLTIVEIAQNKVALSEAWEKEPYEYTSPRRGTKHSKSSEIYTPHFSSVSSGHSVRSLSNDAVSIFVWSHYLPSAEPLPGQTARSAPWTR